MGQTIKDQKLSSVLARNQDFAKGKNLNFKLKSFTKISKLGVTARKLVQLNRVTDEGLGA